MSTSVAGAVGVAEGWRYSADMASVFMGVEAARRVLGARVKAATESDEKTVLTIHGNPKAVVVSIEWYRRASELLGEVGGL